MRQVVVTKHGGPEVLKVQEIDDPKPTRGKVAIRVKAAGINFADILARKGLYPDAPKPPCVVGYEVSGIIESVGETVNKDFIGKEVLAMTNFGGYSDIVIVPVSHIFEKPKSINFTEAAALPVNYLTAHQLLVVMGSLKKGESILIHNAGGGVGLAALDIAKHVEAEIYGTASSTKHIFLIKRGMDHVIDYRTQDWTQVLKQLTNGKGVELVIDSLGGKNWKKSYKLLCPTGRLGMFGISTITESSVGNILGLIKLLLQTPRFNPISLMNKNKGVFGVHLGHLGKEEEKVKAWMQVILNGVQDGWIRPYVDRSFSFDEAAQAHKYIEQRRNIGKVVLIP